MKRIESILIKNYNLEPTAKQLNGPRCLVAQNNYLTASVSAPGYLDFTDKWIVRFIPSVWCHTPNGCEYVNIGAMIEERFDSKRKCIRYLSKNNAVVYKRLYVYVLGVIKDRAKSVDELYNLDPTNRGEFLEVLK